MHPKPRRSIDQLRPIWALAAQYPRQWFLAFLFLLLAAASTLSVPLAFRGLIDQGLSGLAEPFGLLVLIAIALGIFTALRFYFMSWLGERVVADLRRAVYAHVLVQPPRYFETLQTGEVLSRLTADTTLIQTLIGTSVSMALRSGVLLSGGITMMLITSPFLASLMVVLLLAVVLPVLALGRRVRSISKDSQDRVADTSALAGEVLNAISTVQAYGREPFELSRYVQTVERAFEVSLRRIRSRSMLTLVAIVLAFLVIVFVLWLGAREVAAGSMSAGELAQFVLYATLTAGSIAALAEGWGDLQRAIGATERLVDLMGPAGGFVGRMSAKGLLEDHFNAEGTQAEPVRIAFDAISFAYPSRPNDWALRDLTLNVEAGETIALVGPSGAGKSTVFQLILGFFQAQSGAIRINGRPIEQWDLPRLRGLIGVVSQDPVVFSDDAMGNIRYGRLNASDDEVRAAAQAAHADQFIGDLPQGYASFLGERGVRLSGGQRQRIAIARAILRNPPLLLLDEATSALDTVSERLVQSALERLLPGRTALVIAHRLSTVRRASRIVVMDAGRLVAVGSHEELMRESVLYQALARQQFFDH
ncbi:MAG: ATP-binding cassette domain-containing protein [Betaproteobacteria bacterium]|nr:ATP-binding cassette domain-containing protein [Betaproteobacteria bacterium]